MGDEIKEVHIYNSSVAVNSSNCHPFLFLKQIKHYMKTLSFTQLLQTIFHWTFLLSHDEIRKKIDM